MKSDSLSICKPDLSLEEAALWALTDDDQVRDWMGLFHRATGLAIRLLPANLALSPAEPCGHEHPFCGAAGVKGSTTCNKTRRELHTKLCERLTPQQIVCGTGMTEVAVPVVVDDRHVGTFLVGQAFLTKPDARSWQRLAASASDVDQERLRSLRSAYLNGCVVPDDTLQVLVQMVSLQAHRLTRQFQSKQNKRRRQKSRSAKSTRRKR